MDLAITGSGFRWVTAVLLWAILRVLWPQHPRPALWSALFFLVYPGMGQHFISMMYSHFYIVLSCYLLSLYLSLLAIRSEKYRVVLFLASYVFAAVNLLTMEYFYFLEFARLFLFWHDVDQEQIKSACKKRSYTLRPISYFPGRNILAHVLLHFPECQL